MNLIVEGRSHESQLPFGLRSVVRLVRDKVSQKAIAYDPKPLIRDWGDSHPSRSLSTARALAGQLLIDVIDAFKRPYEALQSERRDGELLYERLNLSMPTSRPKAAAATVL